MKKYIKNEHGISLIELLAVLAIGSIILLLISNIHIFGLKQSNKQSAVSSSLFNVSYAAKVITKEIRKAETVEVNVNDKKLTLNLDKPKQVIFEVSNQSLQMNGRPIVQDISLFKINRGSNSKILELDIESTKMNAKIASEIYFRGGEIYWVNE